MNNRVNPILIYVISAFLLSACGASKKDAEGVQAVNTAVQDDITRPPVFVKRGQQNSETDPEETISAEEWQKEQEKEQ